MWSRSSWLVAAFQVLRVMAQMELQISLDGARRCQRGRNSGSAMWASGGGTARSHDSLVSCRLQRPQHGHGYSGVSNADSVVLVLNDVA